jgi:hypothetical protein
VLTRHEGIRALEPKQLVDEKLPPGKKKKMVAVETVVWISVMILVCILTIWYAKKQTGWFLFVALFF